MAQTFEQRKEETSDEEESKRLYSILTFLPLVVSIFACPILPKRFLHTTIWQERLTDGKQAEILIIQSLPQCLDGYLDAGLSVP